MKHHISLVLFFACCLVGSSLQYRPASAQVTTDGTTSTTVNVNGNNFTINQGDRAGSNLFHSFRDFTLPNGESASFNNATDIVNIFSRVTGGNVSDINGLIEANGGANLFLINPAGIIFGQGARLDIGGSFLGSTADSILFEDGEFSATDLDNPPLLTINAPIGLSFRDNPGDIVNRSVFTDDTGQDLIGLRVQADQTLALLGGNVLIEGGFLTTEGGRIELGSVGENSTVSIIPVEKGFDFGYEEVANFQDISLPLAAFVANFGVNPGDIELQGRNISLTQGSGVGIFGQSEGEAGDVKIIASESLTLDGNGLDAGIGDFPTIIFSQVSDNATGERSSIYIDAPKLTITNGAQIFTNNFGTGQSADININAAEIIVEKPFIDADGNNLGIAQILARVETEGTGDGGDITITTETLTVNEQAQINTTTFGAGNAGNLSIDATKSVELSGANPENNNPSGLLAGIEDEVTATGNGGNITITTPRLEVRDGAQIGSFARNQGDGGNIVLDVSESILLSGTSPTAEFRGLGRSGILVSTEPSFTAPDSGTIIPSTGQGGNLTLKTGELVIENGALISADTFSLGDGGNAKINVNNLILRNGGTIGAGSLLEVEGERVDTDRGTGGNLDITANESVEITGIGKIQDDSVNSSIFTLAESNGDAGDLTLTTNNLTVSDGGEINTSAEALGAAGDLTITANSLELNQGTLNAETAAGTGGNIKLDIDDTITLSNNSLISAAATGTADGGNIDIDTNFIIALTNQNNDIIASAEQEGTGGRITIDAESIFGIQVRRPNNLTNDIDASGGVDGEVIINTPDADITKGLIETPQNIVESEQTVAQACRRDLASGKASNLIVKGKGSMPPEPTEPLVADPILVNGQITSPNPQAQSLDIKPIKTSMGDIYPARGVIVREDGSFTLTAYPTDNKSSRLPTEISNCEQ